MALNVGVLDYGMGNLRSVAKALEAVKAKPTVSDVPGVLKKASLLVVPGVGSFGAAMGVLRKKKLDEFLQNWLIQGKPYLGVCLGLQILFDKSEEAPGVKGLGVFRGRVKKFSPAKSRKVPHMGWNQVVWRNKSQKAAYFYFVHSYFAVPVDRKGVTGVTTYGKKFCSVFSADNILATQFHPEKSGAEGLRFLKAALAALTRKGRDYAHHTSH